MLNSNVIGRLGADAELKQTKNGKSFVSYRVASDDFVNGNKITQWVRVTDFTEKGNRLLQYLKKGSLVNVSGILSVSQYQSNKDGSTMFSIDLNADRVDFISNGSGSTTTDETVVVQQATNKVEPIPSCGTLERPTPIPTVASAVSSDAEDDLPF